MAEPEKKNPAEAGGQEQAAGAATGIPPKVDHKNRFLAMLIDGLIAGLGGGIVGAILNVVTGMIGMPGLGSGIGQLLGAGYLGIRDSLNDGRSFGKKFMKLRVKTPSGAPCTQAESINRNMLIAGANAAGAVLTILMSLPVIGLFFLVLAPVVMLISLVPLYEAIQVVALEPNGRRWSELRAQCYTVPE